MSQAGVAVATVAATSAFFLRRRETAPAPAAVTAEPLAAPAEA